MLIKEVVKQYKPQTVGKLLIAEKVVVWGGWEIKLNIINIEVLPGTGDSRFEYLITARLFAFNGNNKIEERILLCVYDYENYEGEFLFGITVLEILTGINWYKSIKILDNKMERKYEWNRRRDIKLDMKIGPAISDLVDFEAYREMYRGIGVIPDTESKVDYFRKAFNYLRLNYRFKLN